MSEAPPERALQMLGIGLEPFSRNRTADLAAKDRGLYCSILEGYASGVPPTASGLVEGGSGAETLGPQLRRLQAADVIGLDGEGEIALAYPFSTGPTRHRVDLSDGRRLWACCAIDALGIPSMLGVSGTIHAVDPDEASEVEVSLGPSGEPRSQPAEAVVLAAAAGEGSSAGCACPYINFFASRSSADRHLNAHPELSGTTMMLMEATGAGRLLFGELLSDLKKA